MRAYRPGRPDLFLPLLPEVTYLIHVLGTLFVSLLLLLGDPPEKTPTGDLLAETNPVCDCFLTVALRM